MKTIEQVRQKPSRPERVLLFGEGNFLRAFAAVVVQKLNENAGFDGSIVVLQGTENGLCKQINAQNGLYTVIARGAENGQAVEAAEVVDCVSRCIDPYVNYAEYLKLAENPDLKLVISNTTEFGICYDKAEAAGQDMYRNFPAKLTDFLYRRFTRFGGAADKGLIVLPCELIEQNGKKLKEFVRRYASEWRLPPAFFAWLGQAVVFADTLVDRIVSGYPKAEAESICQRLGYQDALLDVCEPYLLWVIESESAALKTLPFDRCGLDIIVTKDLRPYRTRKVRILNGAHTMSVPAGHLCGFETVEDLVKDPCFNAYIRRGIFEEIMPSFEGEGLEKYAEEVIGRFFNPYLKHKLAAIALNSISKFQTRVLPSIKDYVARFGKSPACLSFSFAALYVFYRTAGEAVQDEPIFLAETEKTVDLQAFMRSKLLWGENLSEIPGFYEAAADSLTRIEKSGIQEALRELSRV
jgi:tagaturonate reductase